MDKTLSGMQRLLQGNDKTILCPYSCFEEKPFDGLSILHVAGYFELRTI